MSWNDLSAKLQAAKGRIFLDLDAVLSLGFWFHLWRELLFPVHFVATQTIEKIESETTHCLLSSLLDFGGVGKNGGRFDKFLSGGSEKTSSALHQSLTEKFGNLGMTGGSSAETSCGHQGSGWFPHGIEEKIWERALAAADRVS
jgi:hypothetical protein